MFLRYALTDSGLRIRVVTRTRTYFAVPDPSRAKASCAHRKLVGRTANRPNNRVYDCLVVSGNADMFSAAAYRHLCRAPRLACLSTGPVRLYLCIVYRSLASFGTRLVVATRRVQRHCTAHSRQQVVPVISLFMSSLPPLVVVPAVPSVFVPRVGKEQALGTTA